MERCYCDTGNHAKPCQTCGDRNRAESIGNTNIREENKELGGQLGQLRVANTEKREEIEKLDKECDEAQVRFNAKNEEQATIRIASGTVNWANPFKAGFRFL